jgi:hypothetical protein
MSDRISVGMIAWRRPDYFDRVLTALEQCEGADRVELVVSIDGGYPMAQDEMVVRLETSPLTTHHVLKESNIGCAGNMGHLLHLLMKAPRVHVDRYILLEDDTVPSRGFLTWMEAALDRYEDDPDVWTISGYSRREEPGDLSATERRRHFTPWGWGTWRSRLVEIEDWFGTRWNEDAQGMDPSRFPEGDAFLRFIDRDPTGSWAWPMNKFHRRGRSEVAPVVSRVQNVGAEMGVFNPDAAFHQAHCHTPVWMGEKNEPDAYEWN